MLPDAYSGRTRKHKRTVNVTHGVKREIIMSNDASAQRARCAALRVENARAMIVVLTRTSAQSARTEESLCDGEIKIRLT